MPILNTVCFMPRIRFILSFFLFVCLGLPLTLYSQTVDSLSSIIGQAFIHFEARSGYDHDSVLGTFYQVQTDHEIKLVADGDTLRTKSDKTGLFIISGIDAKEVTLLIEADDRILAYPFSTSFELSPGDNIVLVPLQRPPYPEGYSLLLSLEPIVTMNGDTWVYHYPSNLGVNAERPYVMTRLKDMPGVEFVNNRRTGRKTISAPQKVVRMSEANGAFIFSLKPHTTP